MGYTTFLIDCRHSRSTAIAGKDKHASSSHELHIAATNNALPEYGNCQPESKYDSDYFKAAH